MNNGKQPITPSMWTKVGDGADDYTPLKDGQKTGWEVKFGGLTKREYFVAMAMQGLLSNPSMIDSTDFEWIAQHAAVCADIIIEKLNESKL
jgi:hypothetical protein